MSGHSKWSKVKHQKATTDVVKGQLFTKASQAITLAVREGGGLPDPNANFKLRLAIDKAKAVNMPKDTIERAIARASGGEGLNITERVYEGFGPAGSALLILVLTDNPNRSVSSVKNILERHGGSMASQGAVSHQFKRSGIVIVQKNSLTLDDAMNLALETGADDVINHNTVYEFQVNANQLATVKNNLESKKVTIVDSEFGYIPINPVQFEEESLQAIDLLVSALENLEDVVSVFTNVA